MVENSLLSVHPGERSSRTVLDECLPANIEQIHPNFLRGMGKRRFVTKPSHSASGTAD